MPQFYTKIVGVTFANTDGTDRQDIIETLDDELQQHQKVQLRLKRAPENSFDHNAIEVHDAQDRQIGFLSRSVSETLAPMIDNGIEVECFLQQITGHSLDQNFGINILIVY